MNSAALLVLCLIFLWVLASASLPFLALRDRNLAASRRRVLYDKSAGQIRHLTVWTQLFLALALMADLLAGGTLVRMAQGLGVPLLWLVGTCAVTAAFLSVVCFCFSRRDPRSGIGAVLGWLNGLFATASALGIAVFVWFLPHPPALTLPPETPQTVLATLQGLLPALKDAFSDVAPFRLLLFIMLNLTLALAAGQGLTLVWHLLRRRRDDFGRDYYAFITANRSRRAAYAGASLLPFAAAILWLSPASLNQGCSLWGWSGESLRWILDVGSVGLLLAVICWYGMARAEAPLRRKSLAFLALPLLWAGLFCLLMRSCLG